MPSVLARPVETPGLDITRLIALASAYSQGSTPADFFAVDVVDDSLYPSLMPGDLVVALRDRTPRSGRLSVVKNDNGQTIRSLRTGAIVAIDSVSGFVVAIWRPHRFGGELRIDVTGLGA